MSVVSACILYLRVSRCFVGPKEVIHYGVPFSYSSQCTSLTFPFLCGTPLLLYCRLEPNLLQTLASRGVSLFAAPWVFREHGLKLGPFTGFVMDVLVDCAGAPLVEEAVKLWVVLRSGVLPKQVRKAWHLLCEGVFV